MSSFRKGLSVAAVLAVLLAALPVALFIGNLVHIKMRVRSLGRLDHARVLEACRQAITNQAEYRNDNAQWGYAYKDDVVILPPMPENLPQPIRELRPRDVIIRGDSVLINLSLPFSRLGLVGFKPGAKQTGTFQYMDGLWFWDGNIGTTNRANQG
jgi:hypothetical protein